MKRSIITTIAILAAASMAFAGPRIFRGGSWGAGGCDAAQTQRSLQPELRLIATVDGGYSWHGLAPDADEIYLFRDGRQVGNWTYSGQYYLPRAGDGWGEKQPRPPVDPPVREPNEKMPIMQHWQANGVDRKKVNGIDGAEWTINGKKASALESLGAMLDDDSKKLWLVVSGEGREKVLADLKADSKYADILNRTRCWSVPSNHFSLLDRNTGKPMFPIGNPGVFFALPDGTELHKQTSYQGPEDLEALRKADPNFKPDPKKPSPKTPDAATGEHAYVPWLILGACVVGVLILPSRRKP